MRCLRLKKIYLIIAGIILAVLMPIFIDAFVFGSKFSSNISNEVWAAFLGSYIGGIATLAAVLITINDNNKKIEEQKQANKVEEARQRKLSIKPYLDTRYYFFNQEVIVGENDRVFDIEGNCVQKVRYGFTTVDREQIAERQYIPNYVYLRYIIRNIGSGSAVDMKVFINEFSEKMAIAKDESVSIFLLITMEKLEDVALNIKLDYWDTEQRANYYQKDSLVVHVINNEQFVEIKEHTYPQENEKQNAICWEKSRPK